MGIDIDSLKNRDQVSVSAHQDSSLQELLRYSNLVRKTSVVAISPRNYPQYFFGSIKRGV